MYKLIIKGILGALVLAGAGYVLYPALVFVFVHLELLVASFGIACMIAGSALAALDWFNRPERWAVSSREIINSKIVQNHAFKNSSKLNTFFKRVWLNTLFKRVCYNCSYDRLPKLLNELYSHPNKESLILAVFSQFTFVQKKELLTIKNSLNCGVYHYLLGKGCKYELVLKALFKDLSSGEAAELIDFFEPAKYNSHDPFKGMPLRLWEILLEKVEPDDKFKLFFQEKFDTSLLFRILGTDLRSLRMPRVNSFADNAAKVEIITFLLKDLSKEQLTCLLTDRNTVYEPSGSTKSMNLLEVALAQDNIKLINLFIDKGIIEANPEYDLQCLLNKFGVDFTPYRNRLKATLHQNTPLPETLEDTVCDYIIGSKRKSFVLGIKS